jgi:uncharacterized protein
MIAILSPAKTLNLDKESITTEICTQPVFGREAAELISELRNYSPPEMEGLMKVSEELAEINFRRHLSWKEEHTLLNSKQAILSYHGAVFQGLRAEEFNEEELNFAQQHLRILSGLYGALRPLDLVQPYRLEMGIKLKNAKGKDLYCFWKDKITEFLKEEINGQQEPVLINLASNEYFTAIDLKRLDRKIITPVFKEYKNGNYRVVTIYAKRARGLMTRYIIENRIDLQEDLKGFEEEGYSFNEGMSTETELVFTR